MTDWNGKWNYSPVFIGNVDEDARKRFSVAQIQELFDVETLEKYYIFNEIVETFFFLIDQIMNSLGFPSIKISHNQVLLLTKGEFDKKVSMNEGDAGKCHTGIVYVVKQSNTVKMIHDLSHELSHLASYYSLIIEMTGKNTRSINTQTGFSLNKRDGGFGWYGSLDESATELFAHELRKRFIKESSRLSKEDGKRLCGDYVYYKHVCLLNALLTLHSGVGLSKETLFKSYIDGSSDFLAALSNIYPKSHLEYKSISSNDESLEDERIKALGGERLLKAYHQELSHFSSN